MKGRENIQIYSGSNYNDLQDIVSYINIPELGKSSYLWEIRGGRGAFIPIVPFLHSIRPHVT